MPKDHFYLNFRVIRVLSLDYISYVKKDPNVDKDGVFDIEISVYTPTIEKKEN